MPQLPEFILSFEDLDLEINKSGQDVKWVNAFGPNLLGHEIHNLYATETLYGDWNSEILLLAQDALPAAALIALIEKNLSNGFTKESAWRHADRVRYGDKKGWRTNEALKRLMDKFAPGKNALYGSAAAHMLFSDGGLNFRQNLVGFSNKILTEHLVQVLHWVILQMPNLKFIMCLGKQAWRISNLAANTHKLSEFSAYRKDGAFIEVAILDRSIKIFAAFHPMAIKNRYEIENSWITFSKQLKK
jgi:hypothetical protein